jgi:hypothetical protein
VVLGTYVKRCISPATIYLLLNLYIEIDVQLVSMSSGRLNHARIISLRKKGTWEAGALCDQLNRCDFRT